LVDQSPFRLLTVAVACGACCDQQWRPLMAATVGIPANCVRLFRMTNFRRLLVRHPVQPGKPVRVARALAARHSRMAGLWRVGRVQLVVFPLRRVPLLTLLDHAWGLLAWQIGCHQMLREPCPALSQPVNAKLARIYEDGHLLVARPWNRYVLGSRCQLARRGDVRR